MERYGGNRRKKGKCLVVEYRMLLKKNVLTEWTYGIFSYAVGTPVLPGLPGITSVRAKH